ncbi:MAG TPA: hypothetical protein VLT86_04845 [Vicinamibacterales bacterium]|nr:hypothetical protein [Vicinamibacterales bacterium]
MTIHSTWRTRVLVPALAAGALALAIPVTRAQAPKTGADFHLKAYETHQAMTQASPYKNQSWVFLGPTNISGRMADVAVADYPTFRRLYAGSCCGGLWQSDDLGETWTPVFEHEASAAIGDVTVAPSNPDIVWVGTGETNIFRSSYAGTGVYKSTDGAKTWQHMGLTDSQTIGRLVIHPTNPDIVYVAASGHEWTDNEMRGVYKTTDGGKTWTRVLYRNAQTGAVDLVMDPSDSNILYAAMWQRERRKWADPRTEPGFDQSGVFKTTDAGKTWTRLEGGLPPGKDLGRIGLDIARSNPNVVYAFVDNYARGDKAPAGTRNPYGVVIDYYPIGNEVYRSDDKGATWMKKSGQDDAQKLYMRNLSSSYGWVFGNARVDPRDENTIYVLALGVSVSHDAGTTFVGLGRRGGGPPPAPTPTPAVPAVAGQTTTAGASQAGPGVARPLTSTSPGGDNHAMWLDPKDPNFLLSGNDSGFRVSRDGGATWTRAAIPSSTFFDMAFDMDTPFRVYGSVQDHGSYRAVVDVRQGVAAMKPVAFESAPGGEGSTHAIDPTNPNIVYSAGTYGAITRTDLSAPPSAAGGGRGRGNVTNIRPKSESGDADELRGQWLAPMILSPHDPNTLYFGLQYLYRSKDRGQTWERLTPDISGGDKKELGEVPYQTVISISESPKKAGLIYAGTDNGHLQVSIDTGKEWTDLTAKLPQQKWIAKILASKYQEGTVYLAQQGRYDDDFGVYLYKSTDYGKTWKSIAGNLPAGPMNMIQEDPVSPNVLYACNDFGVYVSTNGGQTWDVLGGNLPSVNVMDFIVHPRDHVLVAATHGRGVWVLDVSQFER